MDFFSQTYNALRGPTGAPQTASETIQRLVGRLSPDTLPADRRAAVLSLKGLSRDWRADVCHHALPGLLQVLENDSETDEDMGKAVLETLHVLCDVGDASPAAEQKAVAMRTTDELLKTDRPVQKLFALLGSPSFYVKYCSLQLLAILIHNRRTIVQGYFLKAQNAPGNVLGALEDKREIIRNEALILVQALIAQGPDIQKLFAFEGAFDKLFAIVRNEGGVDGGTIVNDCLSSVDGLLRLNVSNQTFFRENGYTGFITSLLYYPVNLTPNDATPQEFALQFWDAQKTDNVRTAIGIIGLLVGSRNANEAETNSLIRCLVEIALASNAPTNLKSQALRLLPTNLNFPFISHIVTPYIPVPETQGAEWDRLEPIVALDALIELVVVGEYASTMHSATERPSREELLLRTAGATVLENYTRKDDLRQIILSAMLPNEDPNSPRPSPALIQNLISPPSSPPKPHSILSTHLSSFVLASLIRASSNCKQIARQIKTNTAWNEATSQFFVPADGGAAAPTPEESSEDVPQTLIAILAEHLSISFLSRSHAASAETEEETREWDRMIVVYLTLLVQWLWEDPKAVREFLENGGLGMIVEPINQSTDVDPLVQGLCAYLLGICYQFNREPGEITRAATHSIITRLSVDALVGRMSRVREDERFRAIGPDDIILPYRFSSMHAASAGPSEESGVEIWFDWAFVDFWKSNYYPIQRAIALDPDSVDNASGENSEAQMLVASLRDVIKTQALEIEELNRQSQASAAAEKSSGALQAQITTLTTDVEAKQTEISEMRKQLATIEETLAGTRKRLAESEKEQEDLLVFLDEVSAKRKRDKERLKALDQEVSEDEGGENESDGEGE